MVQSIMIPQRPPHLSVQTAMASTCESTGAGPNNREIKKQTQSQSATNPWNCKGDSQANTTRDSGNNKLYVILTDMSVAILNTYRKNIEKIKKVHDRTTKPKTNGRQNGTIHQHSKQNKEES